jgi:hypothetical protein
VRAMEKDPSEGPQYMIGVLGLGPSSKSLDVSRALGCVLGNPCSMLGLILGYASLGAKVNLFLDFWWSDQCWLRENSC